MLPRSPGREVSRIEGFSDAVFGFALTLLVVSLEVPESFADLKAIVFGFVPFGLMFALICWIWYEHYAFFRKYDAEDPLTIALNCVLLFLVLFFVYPLKFLFSNVINNVFRGDAGVFRAMSEADNRLLLSVYGGGFVGMMLVFVLLYWNVYRKRMVLKLTPEEIFDARAGARTHGVSVSVGLLSVVMAVALPFPYFLIAGPVYALQGPLHWRNGVLIARARKKQFSAGGDAG